MMRKSPKRRSRTRKRRNQRTIVMMINLRKLMMRILRKVKTTNRFVMRKIYHMYGLHISTVNSIWCQWIQLCLLVGSKGLNVIFRDRLKNVPFYQQTLKNKSRVNCFPTKKIPTVTVNPIMPSLKAPQNWSKESYRIHQMSVSYPGILLGSQTF